MGATRRIGRTGGGGICGNVGGVYACRKVFVGRQSRRSGCDVWFGVFFLDGGGTAGVAYESSVAADGVLCGGHTRDFFGMVRFRGDDCQSFRYIVVAAGDSVDGGYGGVFGRAAVGKKQMAPYISAGKTWEGFCGGMLCALALVFAVGASLYVAPMVLLLSASAAVVALSVIGDLFESIIKRQSGVKDSGGVLGAHGGVLDRLDATLPVLPFGVLLSPWLA